MNRITGISFPIFGISWNPPLDERKIAEEILTYIENKGIFYAGFEWEHPRDCYVSAEATRNDLTSLMQKLRRKMEVFKCCEIIRDSVREFQRSLRKLSLDKKESKSDMNNKEVEDFDKTLVKLRITSGEQIAHIAVSYGLDIHSELDHWVKMALN
jgi:hypothetical protein